MKKAIDFGIEQKPNRKPRKPVEINLTGEEGMRVFMQAVKAVCKKHHKVLKALASQ